jgi:hypothetical protein
MKHIAGVFIVVVFIIAGVPSSGWADWRDFTPRLLLPGAALGVTISYSSTESDGGGTSVKTRYFLGGQQLTLFTSGYSYDPRFIFFHIAFGIGLQERYQSSSSPFSNQGWDTGEGNEYRVDMLILDKHPYTLNLYALRTRPLVIGTTGTEPPQVQTGKGAIFRYRRKPYFFTTSYTTNSYETSQGTSTSDALKVGAVYFKEYATGNSLSFAGDYVHNSYSAPMTPGGTANYYLLTNFTRYAPFSLLSSVTRSDANQETFTGSLGSKTFTWLESLNVALPLNFGAGFSWNYSDNTSSFEDSTAPSSELSSTGKGISFSITHRLYESLSSFYTFSVSKVSSPSGDTKQTTNQLNFNYTKRIPWGRLTMGANFQRVTVDNSGEAQIVNERHPAVAVPGSFVLAQQEPDPATLQVYVRYPVEPFEIIPLQEGVNYAVTPLNQTLQINIVSLPPQFILPGAFDFFVSYSIQQAEFNIQENTESYNIGLNLFNDLLNPYYGYSKTSSKTLSGELPGGAPPLESTSNVVGLVVNKNPFRASVQYQKTDSNISSNKAWRADLQYNKTVSETTQVNATASYEVTDYPAGTSGQSAQSYTEKITTFSASMVKRIDDTGITLNAGGAFSHMQSLTSSTAYSVNGSLLWRVGKFTLSTGARVALSQSEGEVSRNVRTIHQTYYLNMRRVLY